MHLPEHYALILVQAALSIGLNYAKSVGMDNGTKDAWEQAHNETTLIIDPLRKVIVSSGEQSECICQDDQLCRFSAKYQSGVGE
jgi:hypothetical protein